MRKTLADELQGKKERAENLELVKKFEWLSGVLGMKSNRDIIQKDYARPITQDYSISDMDLEELKTLREERKKQIEEQNTNDGCWDNKAEEMIFSYKMAKSTKL